MKNIFIFSLMISVLLACGCVNTQDGNQVCIKDKCFAVEVADTPGERAEGLMNREVLDSDSGMLFIFEDSGMHSFWMKNTKIPLDIIWFDENSRVNYISKSTEPCINEPCEVYTPTSQSAYVLEVNSGMAESIGIEPGDNAKIMLSE